MIFGIVGGGVSGITFAINIKRKYPSVKVLVFEHLSEALKKVSATGNGKCNIATKASLLDKYRNQEKVLPILNEFGFEKIKEFLDSIDVKIKLIGDLAYPYSESAITVKKALQEAALKEGVIVLENTKVIDYYNENGRIKVATNNGHHYVDKLVFATGGASTPKLGSDGSCFEILKKHNYTIKQIIPGLCPIFIKEDIKSLDGVRVKAKVTLYKAKRKIHEERGEVLFKEKGLSGIVIFNVSSIIANSSEESHVISLDLLPDISVEELNEYMLNKGRDKLLKAYLHPKIVSYFEKNKYSDKELINTIKNLCFSYKKPYGFDYSQITIGGVSFTNLNSDLSSKIENNVYFIGEVIDTNGPCGGYNLMWAVGSALYLSFKTNL